VSTDRLNWSWPAFRAVTAGRSPRVALSLDPRQTEPGLVEVSLANTGEADASWPASLTLTWEGAPLLASDGLAGYLALRTGERELRLRRRRTPWDLPLRPGERHLIAWLRFAGRAQVKATLPQAGPH
jgi:hypothetical protein